MNTRAAPAGWRLAVLGAFALTMSGAAPRAVAGQVGLTEVTDLRFEGNRSFPSDTLARAILVRESECRGLFLKPLCWFGFAVRRGYLPRRGLLDDQYRLKFWYYQRGYRQAAIDTAVARPDSGRAEVTFRIVEGTPVIVDSVEVSGLEDFEGTALVEGLPLRAGDALSVLQMDATRDTLQRRLANLGYARAEVLRSNFIPAGDPYRARVTFDAAVGPITSYGDVTIEGERSLSETTIFRTLQFQPGNIFRLDQILESQARLFALEIVTSASVIPDFTGPDSVIPVRVRLQEGDLHRVRVGAGWSLAECLDLDVRWINRNYFGGARRLQLRGRVSNVLSRDFRDVLCPDSGTGPFGAVNWLASVDFAQPWIFSTRNSFSASLFAERQSLPDVYVREAVGLATTLTRAIGPRNPLSLSYRPERSRLTAAEILFCTSFLVCTPEDIAVLQGANWLAPVGINFTRSTTNNVLNPSRGYTMAIDVEHASTWTGSSFRYNRLSAEMTTYAQPSDRILLAARLRTGWVGAGAFERLLGRQADIDIVHPQKRFYAGGANSVRGFAQSRLGPRVLTVDVEHLLEAADTPRQGAGCAPQSVIDATCDGSPLGDSTYIPRPTGGTRVLEGNVEMRTPIGSRFELAAFTDFGQVWGLEAVSLSDVDVTPGVGIRFLSPIGPIRADLAYRFRGGEELTVVTNQLRAFEPGVDDPEDQVQVSGSPIPWVEAPSLVVLQPRVLFDERSAWSLRRFQLHLSIGQAF